MSRNEALLMMKICLRIGTESGDRRAKAWWYMVEGIRYDSDLLVQVAELLLL